MFSSISMFICYILYNLTAVILYISAIYVCIIYILKFTRKYNSCISHTLYTIHWQRTNKIDCNIKNLIIVKNIYESLSHQFITETKKIMLLYCPKGQLKVTLYPWDKERKQAGPLKYSRESEYFWHNSIYQCCQH